VALYSLFGKYEWKEDSSNLALKVSPDEMKILFAFVQNKEITNATGNC
jgi:hypothetical protein